MSEQTVTISVGNYGRTLTVTSVAKLQHSNNLLNARALIMGALNTHTREIVELLEGQQVNPKPHNEPCCDRIEEFLKNNKDAKVCPYCGLGIHPDLRKAILNE